MRCKLCDQPIGKKDEDKDNVVGVLNNNRHYVFHETCFSELNINTYDKHRDIG